MTKKFLAIALLGGLFYTSCSNAPKQETQPVEVEETVTTVTEVPADEIVTNSVTDKKGVKLDMTYNNTKNTATFVLNGETIELKADTTASGIKYSNSQYVYTEHQGNIDLKKDGKTVFEIKK